MADLPLDILAIAAHRDDVEQTCGGTLLKMAQRGYRTGILDLTQGEMGTRGSAEDRAREAEEAARILQVSWREALDIPDGRVENTWENRLKVARVIRLTRPRVVILPYWKGRHPDHYTASILGYEACFLAGLAKLGIEGVARTFLSAPTPQAGRPTAGNEQVSRRDASDAPRPAGFESQGHGAGAHGSGGHGAGGHGFSRAEEFAEDPAALAAEVLPPHRPFKIIYATLYYDVRPTFVIDITDQFEDRFRALMAYKTQFSDQETGSGIFPAQAEIRARIEAVARHYGLLGGVTYAEPFLQKEVGLVDDLTTIPVKSI